MHENGRSGNNLQAGAIRRFKVSRGLSAPERKNTLLLIYVSEDARGREVIIECGAPQMRRTTKVAGSKCGFMMINCALHNKLHVQTTLCMFKIPVDTTIYRGQYYGKPAGHKQTTTQD